jgi:hypothetical protein
MLTEHLINFKVVLLCTPIATVTAKKTVPFLGIKSTTAGNVGGELAGNF